MLWRFLISTLLLVACSLVFGQDGVRREEAITKLIQVQVEKAGTLLDENTLNALTLRFRKPNPAVSEDTWRQVKSDVKALFIRTLSDPNGTFATSVRDVMPQFSTEDIEKLVAVNSDPTFIKFNEVTLAAMKRPKAELSIRMAIEKTVVEMNDLVIKRGLKPAY
ncbi:MAG: hypothetical protein WC830_09535 [Burkholderiales bacterium]|jgi:hypothetical protein